LASDQLAFVDQTEGAAAMGLLQELAQGLLGVRQRQGYGHRLGFRLRLRCCQTERSAAGRLLQGLHSMLAAASAAVRVSSVDGGRHTSSRSSSSSASTRSRGIHTAAQSPSISLLFEVV